MGCLFHQPVEKRALAEIIAELSEDEAAEAMADLDPEQLLWDWHFWGRPAQQSPAGDWLVWLILAGRGFGKTRAGSEWVRDVMTGTSPSSKGTYGTLAIVGETAWDCRNVIVEAIMRSHPPSFRPSYTQSLRRLEWPNGARAFLYNATEPDQLRGPEHDAAWCDELAKWRFAQETWDQLQFGLRTGTNPRQLITTTPRPIPIIRDLKNDPTVVVTQGSTYENRSNLSPAFLKKVVTKYEGTRLGRQELLAEVLDDIPGALWTRALLDGDRKKAGEPLPDFVRVVVGVDPSGTSGDSDSGANSVGIVVAAKGVDGHGYVLGDYTCDLSPEGWGRQVINAYKSHSADRVVAEVNFGGAMVEAVLRSIDRKVSYRPVRASRGKVARAEPISSLYEQHKIHHVGSFPEMEDQLVAFTGNGYVGEGSPDRGDALVWALTELMLTGSTYRINL